MVSYWIQERIEGTWHNTDPSFFNCSHVFKPPDLVALINEYDTIKFSSKQPITETEV